jgi:hypothetical protein
MGKVTSSAKFHLCQNVADYKNRWGGGGEEEDEEEAAEAFKIHRTE